MPAGKGDRPGEQAKQGRLPLERRQQEAGRILNNQKSDDDKQKPHHRLAATHQAGNIRIQSDAGEETQHQRHAQRTVEAHLGIGQTVDQPGRRLLLEVTRAVAETIGGGRTGIRLSPVTPANDIVDANPQPLFEHVVRELAPLDLAWLHVVEGSTGGPREIADRPFDYAALRKTWRDAGGTGAWMVNNGYDGALARQALEDGADLVSFGKAYIANPDLVARLRAGGPFNTPDRATFYGGGEKGYTDYPALGT